MRSQTASCLLKVPDGDDPCSMARAGPAQSAKHLPCYLALVSVPPGKGDAAGTRLPLCSVQHPCGKGLSYQVLITWSSLYQDGDAGLPDTLWRKVWQCQSQPAPPGFSVVADVSPAWALMWLFGDTAQQGQGRPSLSLCHCIHPAWPPEKLCHPCLCSQCHPSHPSRCPHCPGQPCPLCRSMPSLSQGRLRHDQLKPLCS